MLILFKAIKLLFVSITCSGKHPSELIKRLQYVQYCGSAGTRLLSATGTIKRKIIQLSWFIIWNSIQPHLTRSLPPCAPVCLFTQLCVDWETLFKSINFEKHNRARVGAKPAAPMMRGRQAICHLCGHWKCSLMVIRGNLFEFPVKPRRMVRL